MADSFIRQHLTDAENALSNRKRHRRVLDREIEVLEEVVRLERALLHHLDAISSSEEQDLSNVIKYGSKQDRIETVIKNLLEEQGTVHRNDIKVHLQDLTLVGSDDEKASANVSTYLSKLKSKGVVMTDHNGNWSLAESELTEPGPMTG